LQLPLDGRKQFRVQSRIEEGLGNVPGDDFNSWRSASGRPEVVKTLPVFLKIVITSRPSWLCLGFFLPPFAFIASRFYKTRRLARFPLKGQNKNMKLINHPGKRCCLKRTMLE